MTDVVYNRGKFRIMDGLLDLSGANLRAILATAATVGGQPLGAGWDDPDLDTLADLDAIVDVTLHTADRQTPANPTVTQDDANDRANADFDNIAFGAVASQSALAIFIYDEGGGTDATRFLVYGSNTNFPQPLDGGLTVQVNDWLRGV